MPQFLKLMTGEQAGTQVELTTDVVRMGRHPSCEVVIELNAVSRFHAQLRRQADGYVIEDLKSRNGTFVNGRKIEGQAPLKPNDRIKICDMLLVYLGSDSENSLETDERGEPVAEEVDGSSTVLKTLSAQRSDDLMLKVKPEAKLRAILEISQALGHALELDLVFAKILDSLFKIFPQADRAMILLAEADGQLRMHGVKQRRETDETPRYSRTIVRQAMSEKAAILSADTASDERFSLSQSIADYRIRSVMCVPLLAIDQTPLGVIQLDTQNFHQRFEEEDLQILTSVATQASISIENARMHEAIVRQIRFERELDFAKDVQAGFLPRTKPAVPGYDFWAFYEAAGQIGGDFYDFAPMPDGSLAVLVGDVSGKGVPAALLMAKATSDVKVALLSSPDDLGKVMTRFSDAVCAAELDGRFITLIICILQPTTGKLRLASAGHMSPIIRRADGTLEEPLNAETTGVPIGVVEGYEYVEVQSCISPAEAMLLYSDGISEAMNSKSEMYTIEGIHALLKGSQGAASAVGDRLLCDVRRFVAGHSQSDDMTVVMLSRG